MASEWSISPESISSPTAFTLKQAKEYFIECGCSHFHLSREGDYDAYLATGISKDQELEWLEEYRARLLQKFDACDTCGTAVTFYLISVSDYGDYDAMQPMMDRIDNAFDMLDSYTKVLIGKGLLDVCKGAGRKNDHPILPKAKSLARRLFEWVVNNGIVFASELGIHDAESVPLAPTEIMHSARIGISKLEINLL